MKKSVTTEDFPDYLRDSYFVEFSKRFGVSAISLDIVVERGFLSSIAWIIQRAFSYRREPKNDNPAIFYCLVESESRLFPAVTRFSNGDFCVMVPYLFLSYVRTSADAVYKNEFMRNYYFRDEDALIRSHPSFPMICDQHSLFPTLFTDEEYFKLNSLSYYCLTLYIFHELVHVWDGHLRFMNEFSDRPFLQGSLRSLTLQTLEFDADVVAVQALVGYVMEGHIPIGFTGFAESEESRICLALLFVYVTFYSDSFIIDKSALQFDGSHPPLERRFWFCIDTIIALIVKKTSKTEQEALQIISPALQAIGMGLSATLADVQSNARSAQGASPEAEDRDGYLEAILFRWSQIRDDLSSVKFLGRGLASPQFDPKTGNKL